MHCEVHGARSAARLAPLRTSGVRRAALRAAMGGLVLLAPFAPLVGSMQTASADVGIKAVGHIPIPFSLTGTGNPTSYLSIDTATQRGYLAYQSFTGTGDLVYVLDLAHPGVVAKLAAPDSASIGQGENGDPAAGVDEVGHRIFFFDGAPPIGTSVGSCPAYSIQGSIPALAVLSEASLSWKLLGIPCLPSGDAVRLTGMSYDAQTGSLYVIGMDEGPNGVNFVASFGPLQRVLMQIDPNTGHLISSTQLTCDYNSEPSAPVTTELVGRSGNSIVAACTKTNPSAATGSTRDEMVINVVPIDAAGRLGQNAVEERGVGDSFGAVLDPDSGLVVIPSNVPGYNLGSYVLDTSTGFFHGFVPTSNDQSLQGSSIIRGFGVNTAKGRLYMQTHDGLIVSDFRHQPVPVGLSYPEFADTATTEGSPQIIDVDAPLSRIFVPNFKTNAYDVYEDDLPPTVATLAGNPDSATADIPEVPGQTAATFSGVGDAYGAAFISVGGVNRQLESENPCSPNSPTGNQQVDAVVSCPYNAVLSPGDRDWFFGRSASATLTTIGAAAQASALEATDSATAGDLQGHDMYGISVAPGAPSPAPSQATVPGVTQAEATAGAPSSAKPPMDRPQDAPGCANSGTSGESDAAGTATAACNNDAGTVSDNAAFDPSSGASGMQYGSSVTVQGGTYKGMSVTSSAWAKHIALPASASPGVYIQEIDTAATSLAHGRPGSASASFSRKIYGFSSPSYSCSDGTASPCDPQKVVAAIDAAFARAGVNAAAFAPSPDWTLLHGSPGGYQASVTKDLALLENDSTMNDDPTDTAAGLEIVYYNDGNAGREREVLQFAGVHAESHYGIYALGSTVDSFAGSSPSDAGAPSTGTAGVVGDATPVTTAGPVVAPLPSSKTNPLVAVAHHIADVFQEGWRLLVSDPKTAALLAGVWGLLGMPVYLAIRRRSLVSKIARGVA